MLLAVIFAVLVSLITVVALITRKIPLFHTLLAVSLFTMTAGGIVPRIFKYHSVTVGEKEVVRTGGIFNTRTSYMPLDAVRSVTMVVTPFGDRTGINFVVLNAMGSRMVLPFLTKSDCLRIAAHMDIIIKKRARNDET